MRNHMKQAAIAAVAGAVIAAGGGLAQASASGPAPAKPAPAAATPKVLVHSAVTAQDTDSLQQGVQTSPDVATKVAPKGAPAADEPETGPGTEAKSASEKAGDSDGPGGHQDSPGDVQHEGGAAEK